MPSTDDFVKELEKLATKFVPSEETYSVRIEGEENFNKFLRKLEEHGQSFAIRKSYLNRKYLKLFGFKLLIIKRL